MFFYQAVIMLAVISAICLFAYVIKIKNRVVLAILIILLASGGAGAICLTQNIFDSHFYKQAVAASNLENLRFTEEQKNKLNTIFNDYSNVSGTEEGYKCALTKRFTVDNNGAHSVIDVGIYAYENLNEADQYFKLSQKLYENRIYLPPDNKLSVKTAADSHKYIVTYVKSFYRDYGDIMYLPGKITYLSAVTVQDENVVVTLYEQTNKPVSNKNSIISQIVKKLSE